MWHLFIVYVIARQNITVYLLGNWFMIAWERLYINTYKTDYDTIVTVNVTIAIIFNVMITTFYSHQNSFNTNIV